MYEGSVLDTSVARQNRVNMNYTLLGERNYTFDGAVINQQNYYIDGYINCVYTLKKNDKNFIISMIVNENDTVPEYDDNPVTGIISSLT